MDMGISEKLEWHCVRTQPKHEHIAAGGLRRRLGLEVFFPRLAVQRATRRGAVRVIEPFFPCYLFVRCQLSASLDDIRFMTGVSSLVHFGQKNAVVPAPVIDELKQYFAADEPLAAQDPLYPGAEVTVAQGAFLGFRGTVVRLLPARQRVEVLLDFLGRTTLAEVDRQSLTLENPGMASLVPLLAAASESSMVAA